MARSIIFSVLLLRVASTCLGQLQGPVAELTLPGIQKASVDRLGNFYFVMDNGKIHKYDPDGRLMDESVKEKFSTSLIEPWNPLKVFLYSSPTREVKFLDHHLNELQVKPFEPSLTISPRLVCPDNQVNKFWVFDNVEMALKKVDLGTSSILFSEPIPDSLKTFVNEVEFMREYQNMVFLLNRENGIYIFNSLGNFITHIPVKGLSFFNFLGEELCHREGRKIILTDLRTGSSRKFIEVPGAYPIMFSIITDERLVVGAQGKVIFYKLSL